VQHAARSYRPRRYSVLLVAPIPFVITVTPFAVVILMMLVVTSAMALTVSWRVLIFVPAILYEVDRLSTGVVLAAILAPMFLVFWGDAQEDRLQYYARWRGLDQDRLRIDHWWPRKIADVDTTKEAGLAELDGHADIGGNGRRGDGGHCRGQSTQEMLHGKGPVVSKNRLTCECANSMTR
jgi:hypothetical protein